MMMILPKVEISQLLINNRDMSRRSWCTQNLASVCCSNLFADYYLERGCVITWPASFCWSRDDRHVCFHIRAPMRLSSVCYSFPILPIVVLFLSLSSSLVVIYDVLGHLVTWWWKCLSRDIEVTNKNNNSNSNTKQHDGRRIYIEISIERLQSL